VGINKITQKIFKSRTQFSAIFAICKAIPRLFLIQLQKAFKGILAIILAVLNNYNNFALQLGIGTRKEIQL
jgi:hypothetical protein